MFCKYWGDGCWLCVFRCSWSLLCIRFLRGLDGSADMGPVSDQVNPGTFNKPFPSVSSVFSSKASDSVRSKGLSPISSAVPCQVRHVGFILDGNRRYAQREGKAKILGHKEGAENVKRLIFEWAPALSLKEVTLYTFSMQNFGREKSEVEYLMSLFEDFFSKIMTPKFLSLNIKVQFVGRRELFSLKLQKLMSELEAKTVLFTGLLVRFAMGYGGREEILDAANRVITDVKKGLVVLGPSGLSMEQLSSYMYTSSEPDVVVRTGGDHRTSNFLIWQSWYSEWFFVDKFWPEFGFEDLKRIVEEFGARQRRFGK